MTTPRGSLFRALRVALCALLLSACATKPATAPLTAPECDVIPVGVLDVLCSRLRMDAIAGTAPLAIVDTTRPLGTAEAMAALSRMGRGRTPAGRVVTSVQEANRKVPVTTTGGSCAWLPVAERDLARHRDEMLVEISSPLLHPYFPRQGGLFARVTVGGEGASWYWIALAPHGTGWRVVQVTVLVQ